MYTSSYAYNHANGVTSLTYQRGGGTAKTVGYQYTQAGRVQNVYIGAVGSANRYAKDIAYWAGGAEKSLTLGNNVVEETTINGRQQMTVRTAKLSGTLLWGIQLDYGTAALNDGNPAWQDTTHGSAAALRQSYTYDKLNRLKSVTDPLGTQTFAYDRWGNRALLTGSYRPAGYTGGVTVAAAGDVAGQFPGNRMAGATYDESGNMTVVESRTLVYDGEGRVMKVTAPLAGGATEEWQYDYDGEGRRVRQVHRLGGSTVDEVDFAYEAGGQLLGEYGIQGSAIGAEGLRYVTGDWLGSTRLVTDTAGGVASRHDYLPFGEEVRSSGGPRVKFTGKERENYANERLDYFGARYMSSAAGRFTSPDAPLIDQRRENPQTWNLYSYVRNNPLRFIDPTGECAAPAVKQGETGVCVDLYIAAPTIGVVGKGDNRGPAPNDPKATYRAEIQFAIDPSSGSVRTVKDEAGSSEIFPWVDEFGDKGSLALQGTSTTKISTPTKDSQGNTHFAAYNEATNGWSFLPFAPKDAIKTDLKFVVTPSGQVGLDPGGSRTAYPSIEIYRYDKQGNPVTIYQRRESGNPGDLCCRNQPIPAVKPR